MNCPGCGAAMRLEEGADHWSCSYCGHVHVPDANEDGIRVFEEQSGQACPLCEVPLVHAASAGLRFLHCAQCRGILISMAAFVRLVDTLRAEGSAVAPPPRPPNWKELYRRLDCPLCARRMDTHLYGGAGSVIIDNCPPCAVNWLDHGELRRIVRGADSPPKTEAG